MTVASGNEVQLVTITGGTAGTYTLTFTGGGTAVATGNIAFNATAGTVEAALEALSNLAPADVGVSGSAGGPYTVTFGGAFEDTDVTVMTADDTNLLPGPATVVVTTSSAGNPVAVEDVYIDTSVVNGVVRNEETRKGQRPRAGYPLVSKADYYGSLPTTE